MAGRIRDVFRPLMILALCTGTARAVMPTAEVKEQLKREGRWQDYVAVTADAQRRGLDRPDLHRLAAGGAGPVLGNLKALVILVDFSDNVATAGSVTDTAYFRNLLFSVNNPGRSLNDFYQDNSYGKVTVTGSVVGWFRMPQTYAFYVDGKRGLGTYPKNAQKLAEDALAAADAAGVNFSQFDNDANGLLDGFFVVHAGPGFEETGNVNQIHSHKWQISSTQSRDGVVISTYTMQPEEQGNFQPVNIGVFCHEFGHFFGLPDLYDTDGSSQGLDKWVLMAAGNYARADGSSPAHFSAWSKMQLGWLNPIRPSANLTAVSIPAIENDSVAYRLWTNGALSNQYFLVENRQKAGFDTYLPGSGLLIYHVDDNITSLTPNNNEWYPGYTSFGHYRVALEQADGLWELEKSSGTGPLVADGSDPWSANILKTSFDDLSTPSTRDYSSVPTQVAVWNISNSGAVMTANLDVTWSRPRFVLQSRVFTDNGDADGVPDPGEGVTLSVSQQNVWQGVSDAVYSVSTDDPDLVFTDSVEVVGVVNTGQTVSTPTPFAFSVPAGKVPRVVDFYFTVKANGDAYVKTDTVRIDVGPKQILLVDDDARRNPGSSLDSAFLIPVLDSMRVPFARWEVFSAGTPASLDSYPMVLWYTGNKRDTLFGGTDTLISPSEVATLSSYLDAGGSLLMSGQQVARYLDSMNVAFLNNYLHVDYAGPANDFLAFGIDGDPVSDSLKFVLGGAGGAGNQTFKDLVNPVGSALPIFTETVPANVTGVRFDSTYRVIFIGWGIEGIGDDVVALGGMPKSLLIERATKWLLARPTAVDDESLPLPRTFALEQNYPNPFNPETTIRFHIGPSPAHVRLEVFNILGQQVRVLADRLFDVGTHESKWDGRDDAGRTVGSGVYFYRMSGGVPGEVRKMLLLK
jgi:immune inhibitor A